ncbi:MAG: hypothetical protein KJZ85_20055 [Rhodobacteraceae bacterium]|nr:hypothetical protein [Paracoccaceae bacterium]
MRGGGMAVVWALAALAGVPAGASGWACSGEGLPQVGCGAGGCEAGEGLTPVAVSLTPGGILSACYYTGCHEGPVTALLLDGGLLTAVARDAGWSHPGGSAEPVGLMLRPDAGFGVLVASGFFTPVRCDPWDGPAEGED